MVKALALNIAKNTAGAFVGSLLASPLFGVDSVSNLKKAGIAAFGALLLGIYNALNPNDPRFGTGA